VDCQRKLLSAIAKIVIPRRDKRVGPVLVVAAEMENAPVKMSGRRVELPAIVRRILLIVCSIFIYSTTCLTKQSKATRGVLA
jgi:hypothetical protein